MPSCEFQREPGPMTRFQTSDLLREHISDFPSHLVSGNLLLQA